MTEKGKFLKKLNEAFAINDTAFLMQNAADDICWTIVGDRTLQGKEEFSRALKEMKSEHPNELKIDNIITHGKTAAVNGIIKTHNQTGNARTYAFCDVYRFSAFKNPKIKEITSYVIEANDP